MKADEFPDAMNRLSALLIEHMPGINERLALNAAAMVKDRVINTGQNAKGSEFGKYSDNEMPAFFFKDKALNGSGEAYYEDAVKNSKGISYKKWREANNRPTDHVSLSFSGTTMKDIGVRKQVISGARIVTSVGAKNMKVRENGDTTEKIVDEYLGPKYGNFLEPNTPEAERLKDTLQKEVMNLITQSFK